MNDPSVVAFEKALCEYTGAPYAVAVKRCCIALRGCCEFLGVKEVTIPGKTYEFVPQTLVRGGVLVRFDGNRNTWSGGYALAPTPIWDFARRFRPGMYERGQYQCLSFHRSKILGHTEGGCVLTDDEHASDWLRVWRDDGRNRVGAAVDRMIGESGLMYPDIAVNLTLKLHWLKQYYPEGHPDLPNSDYPDLSLTDWNGIWKKQLNSPDAQLKTLGK